jgi:hypothetical protein
LNFDRLVVVDWSARSAPSPKTPAKDAIFICPSTNLEIQNTEYFRTRQKALKFVEKLIENSLAHQERIFIGFDFSFGYPAGFSKSMTFSSDPFSIWELLKHEISDGCDNSNNRFEVAQGFNARFNGIGPFWGCPQNLYLDGLPHKGTERSGHGLNEFRLCEKYAKSAHSVWKLFTTGAVGSQSLMGIPHLQKLREKFNKKICVWPFDQEFNSAQIVVGEVYPSLFKFPLDSEIKSNAKAFCHDITDAYQTYRTVKNLCSLNIQGRLLPAIPSKFKEQILEEGWIVGLGFDKLST